MGLKSPRPPKSLLCEPSGLVRVIATEDRSVIDRTRKL